MRDPQQQKAQGQNGKGQAHQLALGQEPSEGGVFHTLSGGQNRAQPLYGNAARDPEANLRQLRGNHEAGDHGGAQPKGAVGNVTQQISGQPQGEADCLVHQSGTIRKQCADIFAQQGVDAWGRMGSQIQQPGLQGGGAGLDGILQIRQDSGQSAQLPDQKRADQEQHHGKKAEGHADADACAD